jgi:hypothetical protein
MGANHYMATAKREPIAGVWRRIMLAHLDVQWRIQEGFGRIPPLPVHVSAETVTGRVVVILLEDALDILYVCASVMPKMFPGMILEGWRGFILHHKKQLTTLPKSPVNMFLRFDILTVIFVTMLEIYSLFS